MRLITQQITDAFMKGEAKKISNTHTDGQSLWLFGNKIAEHKEDGLYISNAGWKSNTTKERLNGIPMVSISQKKGEWYLNGNLWNGEWIRVNTMPPPLIDKDKVGKSFNTEKEWVNSGGYRGYSQPVYAVCGANDTGMWDDSPCRSDIADRELKETISVLKKHKIPTKKVTTESSNVFCIHHYVIVPPYYIDKAKEIVSDYISNISTELLYLA